jgi:membrane protein implicated in regulation of membrane protease activity
MIGFFARGRIAWILALIVGVGLIIAGALVPNTFLLIVGVAAAAFGLIFLILSLVSGGATD